MIEKQQEIMEHEGKRPVESTLLPETSLERLGESIKQQSLSMGRGGLSRSDLLISNECN